MGEWRKELLGGRWKTEEEEREEVKERLEERMIEKTNGEEEWRER